MGYATQCVPGERFDSATEDEWARALFECLEGLNRAHFVLLSWWSQPLLWPLCISLTSRYGHIVYKGWDNLGCSQGPWLDPPNLQLVVQAQILDSTLPPRSWLIVSTVLESLHSISKPWPEEYKSSFSDPYVTQFDLKTNQLLYLFLLGVYGPILLDPRFHHEAKNSPYFPRFAPRSSTLSHLPALVN